MGLTLPVADPAKTRAVKIACGRAHSLVLTNANDVFSLGNNAYGQCGREVVKDEDYLNNKVIHKVKGDWMAEKDAKIVDLVCGQDHR